MRGNFFPPNVLNSKFLAAFPRFEPTMLDDTTKLEDVLLQIALGQSLPGSQSLLSVLSKDILQHSLATHIESGYWELRSQEGLLTPKQTSTDFNRIANAPEIMALPIPTLRRAPKIARPLTTVQNFFRAQCPFWTLPTLTREVEEPNRSNRDISHSGNAFRNILQTALDLPEY